MGLCITLKNENNEELAIIGCNASSEHIQFLRSFVRRKIGKEPDMVDGGCIVATVEELWRDLKEWVVYYLKIDDIDAASSILFSMENIYELYSQNKDQLVKLVWD